MRLLLPILAALSVCSYGAAPIVDSNDSETTSDSFIVVLKKEVSESKMKSHLSWADDTLTSAGINKTSSFNFGEFKGYTIQASKNLASSLAKSADIAFIEADQTYKLPPTSPELRPRNVQANAPWNLARISHRNRGSTDYVFTPTTGTYAYVLDTGVYIQHPLFQGRASYGYNAVGGSNGDENGHGTHIAGIVSSQTYGVARFAQIISVKIFDASGSTTSSRLIQSINWAVQDMQTKDRTGRATAVLTASGGYSAALNSAVASASNSGLFFAVVAGNDAGNAGNVSPGSEPSACTVGGTNSNDAVMSTSNTGSVVDLFAPGQSIVSLGLGSSVAIRSGTTMAAAHIAGLGAYFLALEGPRGAVALCNRLKEVATANVLTGVPPGTNNLLAYNLSGL